MQAVGALVGNVLPGPTRRLVRAEAMVGVTERTGPRCCKEWQQQVDWVDGAIWGWGWFAMQLLTPGLLLLPCHGKWVLLKNSLFQMLHFPSCTCVACLLSNKCFGFAKFGKEKAASPWGSPFSVLTPPPPKSILLSTCCWSSEFACLHH